MRPTQDRAGPEPDEVHIPIGMSKGREAELQIRFAPLARDTNILGITNSMKALISFVSVFGFIGYYFLLRRGLRRLDPSLTVPARVKAAFDTLAEGLLITDERGYVLLANAAFMRSIYDSETPLMGLDISGFPWVRSPDRPVDEPYPWVAAMLSKEPIVGVPLAIKPNGKPKRQLIVNATRIEAEQGQVRGVIITFDDVTELHRTNENLHYTLNRLRTMQETIEKKNEQLKILAANDPLTNCLNRRTFFSRLDEEIPGLLAKESKVAILMLDADHFKSINDRFGHAVGDRVLIGLVDVMSRVTRHGDLIGRYGGEEFCIAVMGSAVMDVEDFAERVRLAVAEDNGWLPDGQRVTVSIGMAVMTDPALSIAELVQRADEALYAAKSGGRNRVVNWERVRPNPTALAS